MVTSSSPVEIVMLEMGVLAVLQKSGSWFKAMGGSLLQAHKTR